MLHVSKSELKMHRRIISSLSIMLLYLSLHSNLIAREGWYSVSAGYEYGHHGVFFINSAKGFVSTEGGDILVTTDGGDNWTEISLLNSYHPSDIFFLNNRIGWMIADDMRAFKTENGGQSWNLMIQDTNSQTTYQMSVLKSIHFINEMIGLAVGWRYNINDGYSSIIIKTSDGGNNWGYQTAGNDRLRLNSVFFTNDTTGWICGENGILYFTSNGGQNWQIKDLGTSAYLNSIFFIDSTHGWIAGPGGTIFRTIDGGQNWIICDNPSIAYLISIHFADTNNGYACGLDGTIIKSTNGGASWDQQISGTENGLIDIYAISADTAYCVGWYGTILKTTNGGIGGSEIARDNSKIRSVINLNQNYPNPFNPSTTIPFQINEIMYDHAIMKIYSLKGELVRTIVENINGIGQYSFTWDSKSESGAFLPTGIYFCWISYGNKTQGGKICLIR